VDKQQQQQHAPLQNSHPAKGDIGGLRQQPVLRHCFHRKSTDLHHSSRRLLENSFAHDRLQRQAKHTVWVSP
jgi:hypothetical protein